MTLTLIARANHGIEWLAAAELELAGARVWRLEHRALWLDFSEPPPQSTLSGLRTVDDVFLPLAELDDIPRERAGLSRLAAFAVDLDRAAAHLAALRLVTTQTFTVVASALGKRKYGRYEMEEAVGQSLARQNPRWRFEDSRLGTPESDRLSLRLHVTQGAFLAARVFQQPLHRRDYRQGTFPGALRPPVAAAMGLLADVQPGTTVLDPFCGAGTIPIEIAALASSLHGAPPRLVASDASAEHLELARENARRAGVAIDLRRTRAQDAKLEAQSIHALVTNPPWDQKVELATSRRSPPWLQHLAPTLRPDARAVILSADPRALATLARAAGLHLAFTFQLSLLGSFPTVSCFTRDGADFFRPGTVIGRALRRNYERHARATIGSIE